MGGDIRNDRPKHLTPEWLTLADAARMLGMTRSGARRYLLRRGKRQGRQFLQLRRSRGKKVLMMRVSDLRESFVPTGEERPMLPEVVEIQEKIEALTASHLRLLRLVGQIAERVGLVTK